MAAAPLLDIEALLKPIAGDSPSGPPAPFDVRHRLSEMRVEKPDEKPPVKADWPAIVKLATDTLRGSSKDLLVAASLVEALVKLHGFAGAQAGLNLLRELVEKCWDRLNPAIADGDLEVRAGPFNWLDDPDHGARFPNTIRKAPVIQADGVAYGWQDWRSAQDGKGPITQDQVRKVVQSTTFELCTQTAAEIAGSIQEVTQLRVVLTAKMAKAAPGLTALLQSLQECQVLIKQILDEKRPPAASDGKQEESAPGAAPTARQASSRAEIYKQLEQAARALQQLEPHSPIPYLIRRAVELGAMPFPDLLRDLVRDQKILADVNRELGIKEAAAKKEGAK
jgi:type VI secretion system protein ImpA